MTRRRSWFPLALVVPWAATLACSGSEPRNGLAEPPDLVYSERNEAGGLWSIHGYWEGEGSREIAPGPEGAPRPAYNFLIVRPTTGELLYVSDDPGHVGYILLNPRTGDVRRLPLPGIVQAWSPTGDQLTTVHGDFYQVLGVDGSIKSTVCGPPFTCRVPQWAPDGKALVLGRGLPQDPADLWRIPLNGTSEVNLTQTAIEDEWVGAYSPDGQRLVYYRQSDLMLSNADGTEARTLMSAVGLGSFPWSPDGFSLAADAMVGDQAGLVVIPLDGVPQVITPPGERLIVVSQIAWSPDGNRLAYAAYDGTPNDRPGVFVINRDGSGRRQLNTPGNTASDFGWIPDLR